VYFYPTLRPTLSPEQQPKAGLEVPNQRLKGSDFTEENRALISSQHLQVEKSWERPGVYAWGSNSGKVIDPNSQDDAVKTPRRVSFFDGQLLRDLKLRRDFGAAITEEGDLVQWGLGFNQNPTPAVTLRGKDLVQIAVSADRILALSSSGAVYSIPAAKDDVEGVATPTQHSSRPMIPFWTTAASYPNAQYRVVTPSALSRGEKVTQLSSGLQHCLMLTSKGRVFSAASSTLDFPSKGQLGIPGLSWSTRPPGPYDQAQEVTSLRGLTITAVATGDTHSVVLDKDGKLFSFGDNTFGQLGFEVDSASHTVDTPAPVDVGKLYSGTLMVPKVTSIAAGGINTFFAVDASQPPGQGNLGFGLSRSPVETISDVWACGRGLYGSLGTGKWTHVSAGPVKVKSLSSLVEFDETTEKVVPLRVAYVSVGSTHSSAVLKNATRTSALTRTADSDTNWGADVLFWGGNEHYQLGTGKRNNLNKPTYLAPFNGALDNQGNVTLGVSARLQLTPRHTVHLEDGGARRTVSMEQRVECGDFITAVYSGC
jgi:alpha-tubulin suppressor-like RCC1 family protein